MIKLQYKKKGQQSCTQNECTIVGHYGGKIMPGANMHPVLCSFWHLLCCLICWWSCWHCQCCHLLCCCFCCHSCWCPLCICCVAVHKAVQQVTRTQGCPTGYPYGSVKIFPRPKLHIRMQIKMPQNLAIY